MAGRFLDLLGTLYSKFQLGLGGPQLKGSSGTVEARNAADNAYATIRAALLEVYGDDIVINAGAAESGADWTFTVTRPSSGMTHNVQVIWPSADPSVGQALTVASFAGDVITLGYTTIAGGAEKIVVDTTSLAFGTSSPLTMYTAPASAVHTMFQVIIDTAFDGTPTMSIGITGTTSKYVGTGSIDLTAPAGTIFEVCPGVAAPGGTENIIATYSAGGATAGAARILGYYAVPS